MEINPFRISEATARKQVTPRALSAVYDICKWLYGENCLDGRYFRVAPSLITRSEAEVFGLSAPRFAYRLRLENGSFFNLRRLEPLARRAAKEHGAATFQPSGMSRRAIRRTLIRPMTSMADSLLVRPDWASESNYHVMTTDLARYYAEEQCPEGVPYLQHIELGGGLCAQAACLMALLFSHNVANEIGGIPEITYWAKNETSDASRIRMSGLSDTEVIHFLKTAGLRSWRHVARRKNRTNSIDELASLLGYLRSNVPVILPADLGRIYGSGVTGEPSILDRFAVRKKIKKIGSSPQPKGRQPHMVVVGGCAHDGSKFIVHDPATVPFLRFTFEQLLQVRRYAEFGSELDDFRYMPVVRKEVCAPLLDFEPIKVPPIEQNTNNPSKGLIAKVRHEHIRRDHRIDSVDLARYAKKSYNPGDFILFNLSDIQSFDLLRSFLNRQSPRNGSALVDAVELALAKSDCKNRWIWAQYLTCPRIDGDKTPALWLWDAQRTIWNNDRHFFNGQLVAVITESRPPTTAINETSRFPEPPAKRRDTPLQFAPPTQERPPKASLISSFSTIGATSSGLPDLFAQVRKRRTRKSDSLDCELYLMMETEIDRWFQEQERATSNRGPRLNESTGHDAVEFLSSLEPDQCYALGDETAERYKEFDGKIVAVATFVPEISRPPESPSAARSTRALMSVGRIAAKLKQKGHPVRCVELVGGSRIRGLRAERTPWWKLFRPKTDYSVQIDESARCLDCVLKNLRIVINEGWPKDVPFAFELEPGCFFVINDLESLKKLSSRLAADELLSPLVGLNLDISHWRLAGITVSPIQGGPPSPNETEMEIMRRVIHTHLSGHHPRAHFGDVRPSIGVSSREYYEWLDFLQSCLEMHDRKLVNSGHVSLELEAAPNEQYVVKAVNELLDILARRAIFDAPDSLFDGSIKTQFKKLAAEWKAGRGHSSSVKRMTMHPAYKQIIGLGQQAVPLILEELATDPDHWFLALRAITGESPIPDGSKGKLYEMTAAWLEWGRQKGLVS